ncbi:hypothetical protein FB45DRAFT_1056019 [Roridomyces roridus]|uniref:Uncharacterized protein n=1 Tax=Roridomyces roridus TaxID=1738132 RepID=A0AAD7FQ70_9AGAR|nr:hypothetical protein FB45DRAFT_1056019 [Roridomyces roridus]
MVELLDARSVRSSLKDPIHDYIEVSPLLCTIIDTPQFQRLRHIKQLGTSYRVWAGVSHNRFEHYLGVAHLARQMVQHLHDEQPWLGIADRDMYCRLLGCAMILDMGRGVTYGTRFLYPPWRAPGKKWKHEDASQMMFRYLLKDNHIEHFCEKDIQFILTLIDGDRNLCSAGEGKELLFARLVSFKLSFDQDTYEFERRLESHDEEHDKWVPNNIMNQQSAEMQAALVRLGELRAGGLQVYLRSDFRWFDEYITAGIIEELQS